MKALEERTLKAVCVLLAVVPIGALHAHGDGYWPRPLAWSTDQIDEVIADSGVGREVSIEGRDCIVGRRLHFKVNDAFAFDIDEVVWLDLQFQLDTVESTVAVSYDGYGAGNSIAGNAGQIRLPKGAAGRWFQQSIALDRARFANLGRGGTDFSISDSGFSDHPFVLCGLSVRRSHTTPKVEDFGWAKIDVFDEEGRATPARVGLYDSSGRSPLPSDEALALKDDLSERRVVWVGSPWPVANRSVFYMDGRYKTRLPVGNYELIVAKGLEYRFVRRRFSIKSNETAFLKLKLRRHSDLASRGWYSGEDHIHYARSSARDDRTIELFTRAEDLNVANILAMDNAATTYFHQYDWRAVRPHSDVPYALVPGQEAPRTSLLGHTTQLNIHKPIRETEHYLLYHRVFEATHAQGGLAGFSHVIARPDVSGAHAPKGMAIDVPFGLVDFAEIFTNVPGTPSMWFDLLNLGYKIPPTAGTDWPFGSVPGSARNYVKVDGSFTPQSWFDGLKQGRTFVTSGPMLKFSLNGHGIGSEIRVRGGEPLSIDAKAWLNPDIDSLASLELIEQGDSVRMVSSQHGTVALRLNYSVPAQHGTWFVVRARGRSGTVDALSAPIYVIVDGQSFWKPIEVSAIVDKLKRTMQKALEPIHTDSTEEWDTHEAVTTQWAAQQVMLKERIDQANAIYDDLARRASALLKQPQNN